MNLEGKKILLVAPDFYGYQKFIQDGLEKVGAIVSYIENKAFRHDTNTKKTYWFQRFLCRKDSYIKANLVPISREKFDLCLFVNLFSFHPTLIENLKEKNPDIKCFLYLWDNIKPYAWEQFFTCFDKIYSFDPVDAKKLGIRYLPNFYPDLQGEIRADKPVDISFVGSYQVHRFKILNELVSKLSLQRKAAFFYLYLHPNYNQLKYNIFVYRMVSIFPWVFRGYKFLFKLISKRIRHALVHHHPLTIRETIQSILDSRCVLDLPFPSQTGCTQRVIQALALNKKVITTNAAIVQDFFYDDNYIKIVSMDHVEVDWDWISQENKTKLNITSLRIDHWLAKILTA